MALVNTAEHDTSLWETDEHVADSLDIVTIDQMSQTKLKKDFEITGKDQKLKVSFYNLFTRIYRKTTNPSKLVRLANIVFCWVPQANKLTGKITIALVDNRKEKEDKNRIETQITFMPGYPVIGMFHHNFAMSFDDLKFMDLEIITHNLNMVRGSMGRFKLGYKTILTGSRLYRPKDAEVFYLPIEKLPELEVESPEDIYNSFVKKMKEKKQKEIDYFTKMKSYIDLAKKPFNELTAGNELAIQSLQEDYETLKKYKKDAERYKIEKSKVLELEDAIRQTQSRLEVYKQVDIDSQPESITVIVDDNNLPKKPVFDMS